MRNPTTDRILRLLRMNRHKVSKTSGHFITKVYKNGHNYGGKTTPKLWNPPGRGK